MINRNSVIAAWTPWTVVSRSSVMSLIITFMFEPAKLQMNWASARGMSILRSAAAFGVAGLIVTERHAPADTGVLAKAASGALEMVPLVRAVNLARALEQLKEAGFWLYGLDERGDVAINDLDLAGRACIVLGAEGEGLRRLTAEKCDRLVTIPTEARLAALNVSNAAAVAAYEWARRRTKSS